MSDFWGHFQYSDKGKTPERLTVTRGKTRISVLTPYLVRVEYDRTSLFCDEPTQCVIDRQFDAPHFTSHIKKKTVEIRTDACRFICDTDNGRMRIILLEDGRTVTDFHSGNLGGTCRTLDGTNGKVKLGEGILSKSGVAVLDDSQTLTVGNRGDITPRRSNGSDRYYFAYGYQYKEALIDYFRLTGFPPLIPRFALGNWWSRYKAYTQDEYETLIKRFALEGIPLSVATVDMDWHWVDVVKRFGDDAKEQKPANGPMELFYHLLNPGWTGYSWNTELFPDPKGFLRFLKDNNLKVTMNLHPASGCKCYEDAYADFCDYLGIDKEEKKQIFFDIADKTFMEGYFRFLHHPHEADGVDFWWIDWQQGKRSKIPGLDPLWGLNHYHYLDNARDGKRPLILSRFAGAGSQRYPLGFSGDTFQTWPSLALQPYFTATASNIGYTWWSHDIGGHHFGYRDDELYLRWLQYGVFSPIMRLHSTSNEFMGKEPWKYAGDVAKYASDALRLRHRLIPYLYTMNALSAYAGAPLCRPMYYESPQDERAYRSPGCYWFGTEMIVCPVVEKADEKTGLAQAKGFLPAGRYTDIFTGRIYNGNREITFYRDESSIPVLAKAGAIIPLAAPDRSNTTDLPQTVELLIYRGNGEFSLYEDDGETTAYLDGISASTGFSVTEHEKDVYFTVAAAKGHAELLPAERTYIFSFRDITGAQTVTVFKNNEKIPFTLVKENGWLQLMIGNITPQDTVSVLLSDVCVLKNEDRREHRIALISKLQGSNQMKKRLEKILDCNDLHRFPACLRGPLQELESMFYA